MIFQTHPIEQKRWTLNLSVQQSHLVTGGHQALKKDKNTIFYNKLYIPSPKAIL